MKIHKNLLQIKKIFLLFVFISVVFVVWNNGILNIRRINIERRDTFCVVSEENIKSSLDLIGKNILFIDENGVNKKLLNKFPCIKNIKLDKKFPQEIKITINERNALASVIPFEGTALLVNNLEATPSSQSALLQWSFPSFFEKQFLVDETGFVFSADRKDDTPLLFWPDKNIKVGYQLNKNDFDKISQIFVKLRDLEDLNFGSNIKTKVVNKSFLVQTAPRIVFSLEKDVLRQLASLQLILQKAKIEKKVMETVDLRFDKPVVIYYSKSSD